MSLIERLEAIAERLERAAADGKAGERMRFYQPVAVLLPDGSVKVHSWSKLQPIDWHTGDDWCPVMSQDDYATWLDQGDGIALAGGG